MQCGIFHTCVLQSTTDKAVLRRNLAENRAPVLVFRCKDDDAAAVLAESIVETPRHGIIALRIESCGASEAGIASVVRALSGNLVSLQACINHVDVGTALPSAVATCAGLVRLEVEDVALSASGGAILGNFLRQAQHMRILGLCLRGTDAGTGRADAVASAIVTHAALNPAIAALMIGIHTAGGDTGEALVTAASIMPSLAMLAVESNRIHKEDLDRLYRAALVKQGIKQIDVQGDYEGNGRFANLGRGRGGAGTASLLRYIVQDTPLAGWY